MKYSLAKDPCVFFGGSYKWDPRSISKADNGSSRILFCVGVKGLTHMVDNFPIQENNCFDPLRIHI
jgi:hypothetical protein